MIFKPKNQVEIFHLMFLRAFHSQIDLKFYAIKGGCNLRFFFNSIRYSEDLDIDIQTIHKLTLEKKVNKILTSPSLLKLLQRYGINRIETSPPKQTETTQRWKIQLLTERSDIPLHTKIEFSRRKDKFSSELGDVDIAICQRYRLPPSRLSHYGLNDAITQKILALAHRSLTQARDIFDLYTLLHIQNYLEIKIDRNSLLKAEESLSKINFDDYKSQVVSFLEEGDQKNFNTKEYWHNITNEVRKYLTWIKNESA